MTSTLTDGERSALLNQLEWPDKHLSEKALRIIDAQAVVIERVSVEIARTDSDLALFTADNHEARQRAASCGYHAIREALADAPEHTAADRPCCKLSAALERAKGDAAAMRRERDAAIRALEHQQALVEQLERAESEAAALRAQLTTTKHERAVLAACAAWTVGRTTRRADGQSKTYWGDPLPVVEAEFARREAAQHAAPVAPGGDGGGI